MILSGIQKPRALGWAGPSHQEAWPSPSSGTGLTLHLQLFWGRGLGEDGGDGCGQCQEGNVLKPPVAVSFLDKVGITASPLTVAMRPK